MGDVQNPWPEDQELASQLNQNKKTFNPEDEIVLLDDQGNPVESGNYESERQALVDQIEATNDGGRARVDGAVDATESAANHLAADLGVTIPSSAPSAPTPTPSLTPEEARAQAFYADLGRVGSTDVVSSDLVASGVLRGPNDPVSKQPEMPSVPNKTPEPPIMVAAAEPVTAPVDRTKDDVGGAALEARLAEEAANKQPDRVFIDRKASRPLDGIHS